MSFTLRFNIDDLGLSKTTNTQFSFGNLQSKLLSQKFNDSWKTSQYRQILKIYVQIKINFLQFLQPSLISH